MGENGDISTFFFSYLKGEPNIGLNKERDIKETRLGDSHHRQLMVEVWLDSCVCGKANSWTQLSQADFCLELLFMVPV